MSYFSSISSDFRLNIFDTSVPALPRGPGSNRTQQHINLKTNMKVINSIRAHPGRWTISDVNLSADNERYFS
jgi:WD repeat-containing protein 23